MIGNVEDRLGSNVFWLGSQPRHLSVESNGSLLFFFFGGRMKSYHYFMSF